MYNEGASLNGIKRKSVTMSTHSVPLTPAALHYTWQQFAQRLGLLPRDPQETGFERLSLSVHYGDARQIQPTSPAIIVERCADADWLALLERPANSLDWLAPTDIFSESMPHSIDEPLPVLFWGANSTGIQKHFASLREDGVLIIHVDIIAAGFFMLSRWEETVNPTRDAHDRVPYSASVAHKQGFLDRPLMDEYALILGTWLRLLRPDWQPPSSKFALQLSHDMDFPLRWPSWNAIWPELRKVPPADSAATHMLKTLSAGIRARLNYHNDAYYQGFQQLMALSEQHNLQSTFLFMASLGGPNDRGYDPTQAPYVQMLREAAQRGFEIGFHPGYSTFRNQARFDEERARFERASGLQEYGGRQHFLRFDIDSTWPMWEAAGLRYDSTLGYVDHEGFRGGTCFDFQPYDLKHDRVYRLTERPAIVVVSTLYNYRKLTAAQAEAVIITLARRCQRVGGSMNIMWYSFVAAAYGAEWGRLYPRLIDQILKL